MKTLTARHYVSPRTRALSLDEQETRRLAYAIKTVRADSRDFAQAAMEMARLVQTPCWLVPIPDRNGNTDANAKLASHIAFYVGRGAQVANALQRTEPIKSQCERHKLALGPISPDQHHFKRTGRPLALRQVYFVDNVTTSGSTLQAAHNAFGCGAGLVFADAR